MEVKKSPKAELESKRSTWLLIGYIIALSFVYVAFEWTQYDVNAASGRNVADVALEEEMIPVTIQSSKVIPPLPSGIRTVEKDPEQVEESPIYTESNHIYTESSYSYTEESSMRVEVKYVSVRVEHEEAPPEHTIFQITEVMPEFPGGQAALLSFLSKNIKYPAVAQENGAQGRVIVQFVVNRDGSVVDPVVLRSVDPSLDREALRVISAMPKWRPGIQRGRTVRVKYTVPVTFKLQ